MGYVGLVVYPNTHGAYGARWHKLEERGTNSLAIAKWKSRKTFPNIYSWQTFGELRSGGEKSSDRIRKNTSAGGIKGLESLEVNFNSQTNIEVDLDLIENLYQGFPFIFSDFYHKKQGNNQKSSF